jgi:hypothetical protein
MLRPSSVPTLYGDGTVPAPQQREGKAGGVVCPSGATLGNRRLFSLQCDQRPAGHFRRLRQTQEI